MRKVIKVCLYALLPLVLVTLLAVWYASTSIKPAQLSQLIGSAVKAATGRDLKIAGPVSLKFFPSIGVIAQQVSLSNASWATQSDMLKVKRMELDIELLPLLRGVVAFNAINLVGVDALLQTNKAGEGNWNFNSAETSNLSAAVAPQSVANDTSSQADSLRIQNINIVDAKIQYDTFGTSPKLFQVTKLSFSGGGSKNNISGEVQHESDQLSFKAKTGNLQEILNQWDERPVKMPIQLNLTINGKSLQVDGEIDKQPKVEPSFKLQIQSKSFELLPLAGSAKVAASNSSNKLNSAETPLPSAFFFSDEALPFAALPQAKGAVSIAIDELGVSGRLPVTGFKGELVFDGQKISANDLRFGVGNKGTVEIQVSLSDAQSGNPAVSLKGMAKGFTLEQLMDIFGSTAKVKGGGTEIAFNLHSSGTSLHQLAGRASGALQIAIAEGILDASFVNAGGDLFITVVNAVNPMRKRSDQTTLECAVAYLPLNNGQIILNNSFGVVTDRLNMTMSGSVDLKTESLNIKIDPKDRSGLTTGVNLGGLVQLQGTLMKPQVGLNKEGVVNSAVSIGLGILTGGATVLAENAKSLVTKNAIQPCKTALHSWSDIYPGMKN